MPRTLTFQQTADGRFGGNAADLKAINRSLMTSLSSITGLTVSVDNIRELTFMGENDSLSHTSFKQRYYIQKNTRKTTWNDIFKIINQVKAAPYDFMNLNKL